MVKSRETDDFGESDKEFSVQSDPSLQSGARFLEQENNPDTLMQSIHSFCETLRSTQSDNTTKKNCIKEIQARLRRLFAIDKAAANKIHIKLNVEFDNAFLHTD